MNESNKKQLLILIDIDGTLKHSDGSISERTEKVIKKHKESYMKFEEQLKQFKESLNFPKNFGVSDYNDLMKEIKKIIIEKALNSELDYHL